MTIIGQAVGLPFTVIGGGINLAYKGVDRSIEKIVELKNKRKGASSPKPEENPEKSPAPAPKSCDACGKIPRQPQAKSSTTVNEPIQHCATCDQNIDDPANPSEESSSSYSGIALRTFLRMHGIGVF